jgi:hypothetical protein
MRQGQLQMHLLGPRLGGSCTPPYKLLKQFANDAFSIRFDDGLGWGFGLWNLGKGGLTGGEPIPGPTDSGA